MELDPTTLGKASTYRLFISLLTPRPIAWVGTLGRDGRDNLAPFSYFMGVGSDPPLLAFSVARGRGGTLKDTARNVLDTGELTISMVERQLVEAMNLTSGAWEGSEFDVAGLARGYGSLVRAPFVAAARVKLEARLAQTLDLHQTHLFVVEVVRIHVADELYDGGVVRRDRYHPVARLGGDGYGLLGETFDIPRVKVG